MILGILNALISLIIFPVVFFAANVLIISAVGNIGGRTFYLLEKIWSDSS